MATNETPQLAPMPTTMHAWQVARRGSPLSSLVLNPAAPLSLPSAAGQGSLPGSTILVKISYAALNPADVSHISIIPTFLPWRRRPITGLDFTGVIVRSGPDAPAHLRPGVEVCAALGVPDVFFGKGTLAEYVAVPADRVAVVPEAMTGSRLQESAGLGITGQTALLMLRAAGLNAGESQGKRALVIGASGGVGTLLVEILKGWGVVAVGVCSGANAEFVKSLGAAEIVDYKKHDPVHAYLKDVYGKSQFDAIFDCVGSDALFDHCAGYLTADGAFVNIVGGKSQGIVPYIRNYLWPVFLGGVPRKYRLVGLGPSGQLQREVVDLVKEGVIKQVPVDSVFDFKDAHQAFERLMTKRAKGKVVISFSSGTSQLEDHFGVP